MCQIVILWGWICMGDLLLWVTTCNVGTSKKLMMPIGWGLCEYDRISSTVPYHHHVRRVASERKVIWVISWNTDRAYYL